MASLHQFIAQKNITVQFCNVCRLVQEWSSEWTEFGSWVPFQISTDRTISSQSQLLIPMEIVLNFAKRKLCTHSAPRIETIAQRTAICSRPVSGSTTLFLHVGNTSFDIMSSSLTGKVSSVMKRLSNTRNEKSHKNHFVFIVKYEEKYSKRVTRFRIVAFLERRSRNGSRSWQSDLILCEYIR